MSSDEKVKTKEEELDELYMVIGSLLLMEEALKKSGTVAHAEKAKQYHALMVKYDTSFVAILDDLKIAAKP